MKKNNFTFFIIIPIIIIFSFILMDTFISYYENKRFKSDTENIITEVMNNDTLSYDEYYNEIKKLYEQKNYDTDLLYVNANSYEVSVENEVNYFGLFSSIKNYTYDEDIINILGINFRYKKNSKTFVKVTAKYDYDGNLEFIYTK